MTNENKKSGLIILIIFLLLLSNIFLIYKGFRQEENFNRYENAILALNDSIHLSIENGKKVWSQKTPEINLDQLVNSEYFKTLESSQQNFYKELTKIKGLIASSQVELQKQGQILAQTTNQLGQLAGTNGDSIQFKLGQKLEWNEQDTSKKFQWQASVILDQKPQFKFDYDYKFKINTTFQRQKDKSILIKYNLDDPELKVNKSYSYIVPKEEKRTKIGRFIDKNKKQILWTGAGILFVAGGATGYRLAQ